MPIRWIFSPVSWAKHLCRTEQSRQALSRSKMQFGLRLELRPDAAASSTTKLSTKMATRLPQVFCSTETASGLNKNVHGAHTR